MPGPDLNLLDTEPAKFFHELEMASRVPTYEERRTVAYYLIALASDMLRADPHMHVRLEQTQEPMLAVATITRQHYPEGDWRNERNLPPALK